MSQLSSASSTSCSNCQNTTHRYDLVSTVELSNLPISVCNGLQILKPDLKTMHEEADVIIPHQVVYLALSVMMH